MTIGVVADTHGDIFAIRRVIAAAGDVDAWIHLGDNIRDAAHFEATGKPVYSVAGNCDMHGESELVAGIYGVKVFITHGHFYGVNLSLTRLMYRAEELGCKAALYGHTHVPALDEDGDILLLNPGSPSRPRMCSAPSYALLYIDDNGCVDADIIKL